MPPPTRKVKGQKKAASKLAVDDEEELGNAEDIAELQRLVTEAQKSRPNEKKKRHTSAVEEEDAASEDEDADDEEARVLLEMKREREALENEEEDEEEEEDEVGDLPQHAFANDAPHLRGAASELALDDFVQSFALTSPEETEPINPEDDKEREALFQYMAMSAVNIGQNECRLLKIPFARPFDFMAEMIKSDDHMARVKKRILFEQEKIKVVEARKAAARNRKRKKEVQKNRTGEKVAQKRKASELSSSFRDKNRDSGNNKRAKLSGGGPKSKSPNRMGKNKRKSVKGGGGGKKKH